MSDGSGQTSKTVEYALRALQVLGGSQPSTPADLAAAVGVSKSAGQRLLATLHRWGLVLREEDGRYSLGPTLLRWATEWSGELVDLARPHLDRLAAHASETVVLAVHSHSPDTASIVVAESSGARGPLRVEVTVGSTFRLDDSAAGLAILAWSDPEIVSRLAPEHAGADLAAVCADVRETGVATARSGEHGEMVSVGAPILLESGQLVGAVAVVGPSERAEALLDRAGDVVATARAIAELVSTSAEFVPDPTETPSASAEMSGNAVR